MPTVNVGGVSYTSNSKTPYMDAYEAYKQNMQKSRETYRNGINEQLAKDKQGTNSQYDNSARQNYVKYMQNRRALPTQLNQLGVNGGASESALLRVGTAYGANVAANEASRGTALASLDQQASSNLANYDTSLDEKLASAYATANENQIKYTEEQRQRDLQNFASSINGRYGSVGEYDSLISQLRASDDANKNEKIALAQQARTALAQQIAERAAAAAYSSGGGGYSGGGYSSYGGGGYSSSSSGSSGGSGSTVWQQVAKQVKTTANKAVKNPKKSKSSKASKTIAWTRRMK